jgi:hypothetical protein
MAFVLDRDQHYIFIKDMKEMQAKLEKEGLFFKKVRNSRSAVEKAANRKKNQPYVAILNFKALNKIGCWKKAIQTFVLLSIYRNLKKQTK